MAPVQQGDDVSGTKNGRGTDPEGQPDLPCHEKRSCQSSQLHKLLVYISRTIPPIPDLRRKLAPRRLGLVLLRVRPPGTRRKRYFRYTTDGTPSRPQRRHDVMADVPGDRVVTRTGLDTS